MLGGAERARAAECGVIDWLQAVPGRLYRECLTIEANTDERRAAVEVEAAELLWPAMPPYPFSPIS